MMLVTSAQLSTAKAMAWARRWWFAGLGLIGVQGGGGGRVAVAALAGGALLA